MDLFWIILVVLAASLIKGITGFGFALISLPLLLNWYPAKELIPVLLACNLLSSTVIVLQKKEQKLVNQKFQSLIIYGGLFSLLGVLILKNISEKSLILILSVFFIILALISLLNFKNRKPIKLHDIYYKIVGAVLGVLTGAVSVNGPPLALFLNYSNVDNLEFREIFAWFSIVTAAITLTGYFFIGIFTFHSLQMVAALFPILYFGSFIGKRLNKKIPVPVFQKLTVLLTLISSIVLLLK